MNTWTPLGYISIIFSILMAVNGAYRFIYYTQCKAKAHRLDFKDVPIDFSIKALGIDAEIKPYEKTIKEPPSDWNLPLWLTRIAGESVRSNRVGDESIGDESIVPSGNDSGSTSITNNNNNSSSSSVITPGNVNAWNSIGTTRTNKTEGKLSVSKAANKINVFRPRHYSKNKITPQPMPEYEPTSTIASFISMCRIPQV